MEQQDPGADSVVSPPAGGAKSKLDTLSKDDLIKFAKKQMAAMQKLKSKCADLEKEVETIKSKPPESTTNNCSPDNSIIQELTERMDAVLLEKAETQQSLVMMRKDNEKAKKQTKDTVQKLATIQAQLDLAREEHQKEIEALEKTIGNSKAKHMEEIEYFQKLLKEREESEREKESEKERPRQREEAEVAEGAQALLRSLESRLLGLQTELDSSRQQAAAQQEDQQRALTEAQQDAENLREELSQKSLQHEEELRALEEDYEIERERLLLLQEELTEQLALKDSYLQDVQEEEEEPSRGTGIARMLELSGCSQNSTSDNEAGDSGRLRVALDDLQAHNTMLQDELTLLGNVKSELEAELERAREEFQIEREELEFKIDELQMSRESAALDPTNPKHEAPPFTDTHDGPQTNIEEDFSVGPSPSSPLSCSSPVPDKQALDPEDQQNLELQGLKDQCEALARERNMAVAEYELTRDILRGLETELGQKTGEFVRQYEALKEQGDDAVKELHEKVRVLGEEKEALGQKVSEATEEKDFLKERLQSVEQSLEGALGQTRAAEGLKETLQASVEEKTALALELKASVEELSRRHEEVLSRLQLKESAVHELEEMLRSVTTETQSLLQLREQEVARLTQERELEATSGREEAKKLREEKDEEVKRLRDESGEGQKKVTSLEQMVSELSGDRASLRLSLEDASTALSHVQGERDSLGQRLPELESKLRLEAAERQQLEARMTGLSEELAGLRSREEQAQETVRALREQARALSSSSEEEVLELRTRAEELERERNMLRSSLEEAQRERGSEEVREELQEHVEELEKERNMLRSRTEEVVADMEALQRDLAEMRLANEKMREENQELQAQVMQASETLEHREREERERRDAEGEMLKTEVETERRELEQQLAEKESVISQLKSEMATLQSASDSTPSGENLDSQLTEKIALLEKESKEKDERMNKIKAVAVKARKELDISKKEAATLKEEVEVLKAAREKVTSSMKDIIHSAEGYKNLQMDYDRQSEQLEKEKERGEAAEKQIAEQTKRLAAAVTQHEQLWSEKEDLLVGVETARSTVRQLEGQLQETHRHTAALDRDLQAERLVKEQKAKDVSAALKEVEELTAQLRKLNQQSQQTAQELEQLRKEAQQNSLLDMEMADYERLVKELNTKLSERDVFVEDLKTQIKTHTQKEDTLHQEIESLKTQVDQGEEKTSKMKQLLVKTKKDLADAKKQDASQMMLQASLKGELEARQQQLESLKIQVCEVSAERHRLQEQLRSVLEQQQKSSFSLQQRITALQEECHTTKAELTSTAKEFDSYKVRVHNVLKQQKSKTTAQGDGDTSKLEREQMESVVEQLQVKLQDSQQGLRAGAAELQQLQAEHDTLLERHNKILQETVAKEAQLRERLLALQTESVSLRNEHAQAVAQLSRQTEAQRAAFREQIRHLQDEHRATVETLQSQISRLEKQLFALQSQSSLTPAQSSRKPAVDRRPPEQGALGGFNLALSEMQSMAREEGEGMETTETESLSPAHTPLPSLEQLLTSPDPKQEPFVWQAEPTKEELSQKLTTVSRSMEHMNSLLHETEATNAVLMEQVTLLKSEVRRLERNHEREKSVANLEYLKNVLLQFIFLRSGSERQALLPVIHTMLQLSPEEKNKLAAIAQGEEEVGGARASGWSSYLHSWSGIR
ncbi:GRIP and coiled-coil domain-containing protein 2 isoform X1 [Osmerus eperlanus]|uniref:GRIP and coiled-coil domain-containing protein 2 isoform X1 n=1 Tax=Osmerus eperlanus TaxID=29151 RepID=UPI002E121947